MALWDGVIEELGSPGVLESDQRDDAKSSR